MAKKIIFLSSIILGFISLTSCGSGSNQTDGQTVETEAQIEAARNAGREAARMIITREFKDSMEFHGAILEAASRKATYQLEKRSQSEAAYDSAFISTIRTVRPDLARQLE